MGGKVVVTAENVTLAAEQAGPLRPGGNYARISIKDHGVGIPPEIIPRLFDPFFTTKSKGHGLGLCTAYSIVKGHGGWIDVESEPGKGSVLHVYIPAVTQAGAQAPDPAPVKHKGSGTVLIMDDEDYVRQVVCDLFRSMGYKVAQAREGAEAIALFDQAEKSGQPYAITMLDLTVQDGIGGREAALEIRKINPRAVVVALSGYSDDPVISNPTSHGFSAGLSKPFQVERLAELLNRITAA
jgi:CheY-like chemotaxis protein